MPDIRPELIDRVRDELAGYLIGGGVYPLPIALDEADELAQIALEAVADDLRAEGAAEALREAADALDAYDATNPPPDDDRWTCDLGYYGEAAWLRNRADQIAGADQ